MGILEILRHSTGTRERESPAAHADILRLTQDLLLTWAAAHGGLLDHPEALVIPGGAAAACAAYAEKIAAAAAVACTPWEKRYDYDTVPGFDEILAREEAICKDDCEDDD